MALWTIEEGRTGLRRVRWRDLGTVLVVGQRPNMRVNAMTNADHLQPSLRRAFDRLARSGEYPKTPDSSRSIRIGMDYPLQVVLSQAIESDEVADAVAWVYCRLGNLQQADPPGDPQQAVRRKERPNGLAPDTAGPTTC